MNLFWKKKKKEEPKVSYETNKIIEQFMREKDSRENKLDTLENTTDINLFFDTIKNIDNIDRVSLEKGLIDRCFEEIDFTNQDSLHDLYTRLKLYKNEMSEETLKYASKLFKYCEENYINKN